MRTAYLASITLLFAMPAIGAAETPNSLVSGNDLFGLSVATDPQISPDGSKIAYVRKTNDIMTDSAVTSIWLVDTDSGEETPLVAGEGAHFSPRWSPDGKRLAYVSNEGEGAPQLHMLWLDSGRNANITALPEAPAAIAWSPDGKRLAYTVRVPGEAPSYGEAPTKPEGAKWKEPLQIIDKVTFRFDGGGYAEPGVTQLFVVDAEGGAARQLTFDDYDNGGSVDWSPDGRTILYSANRKAGWELDPLDSEVYALDLASGSIRALTSRKGPDGSPHFSPDGKQIAYLGFDDLGNAFDQTKLYVMDADGSNPRQIAAGFDRGFDGLDWTAAGILASYEDEGTQKVARIGLDGRVSPLSPDIGSTYYALPYTTGEWSVNDGGRLAYTTASSVRPPDVGVTNRGGARQLTHLNDLKFSGKKLGDTRELAVTAPDGTAIPAWIMLPPNYVAGTKVPMILEMHGGPYASYGPEFSIDYQLYGAAGYAVVFSNPGGSTGYGEAFADRIEDNYPISNFDELMAVVDAAVAAGYADPDNLFVTGGSGGGLLTAWLVGKTDRFRAAAAHKPVINWVSHALTADAAPFFGPYWLGALPWEDPEHYWARSPLSLAGNVKTPTMLLVGSDDYRTPRSEAEQFYEALKLVGVDTALVITPGSSHNNLSQSPSQQAARTAAVIAWFEKYRKK